MPEQGFIPPHGNYKELLSYKKALIVYDATILFCQRFMNSRDRTVDQMVQAARSGKQNIIREITQNIRYNRPFAAKKALFGGFLVTNIRF